MNPILEIISTLLSCPTPLIIKYILDNVGPCFFTSLNQLFVQPPSKDILRLIVECVFYSINDLFVLDFKIADIEQMFYIEPAFLQNVFNEWLNHDKIISLWVFYIGARTAKSIKYGGNFLEYIQFCMDNFDPNLMYAIEFFTTLNYFINNYSSIAEQILVKNSFLKDVVIEKCIGPNKSLYITNKQRQVLLFLYGQSVLLSCIENFQNTHELISCISVDTLIDSLKFSQKLENMKLLESTITLLDYFVREASWCIPVLQDANIDELIIKVFFEGSYQLKRSSLNLAKCILSATDDQEVVDIFLNIDFIHEMLSMIQLEDLDQAYEILSYVNTAFSKSGADNYHNISEALADPEIQDMLQNIANDQFEPEIAQLALTFLVKNDDEN